MEKRTTIRCLVCQAERAVARTGRRPRYCSTRCRRRVELARATVARFEGQPARRIYRWVAEARHLVAKIEEK